MKLDNIKVVVLLCDGFEETEMTRPREALEKAGATVHLINPDSKQVRSWLHNRWNKKFKVDVLLKDTHPENYDALLLPGGVINPDKLRTYPEAIQFINDFFKKKKPIAAICHGPLVLTETKKLKNRKLTSYHSIKIDMLNAGAKWENKKVVIDGNLVTSRQPSDIPSFNRAIIKLFSQSKKK